MDVTKAPPMDPSVERGGASPPPQQQSSVLLSSSATPLVPLDTVDIQPLDAIGALQILIAEVREALSLALDSPQPAGAGLNVAPSAQTAAQAPQQLLQLFLQAVPQDMLVDRGADDEQQRLAGAPNSSAWTAAATQLENALSLALDKGVAAVEAWRAVPQAVVDDVKQTRAVVLSMLTADSNAEWLRPEWLGLAPRIERYRRRRRAARKRLTNPDHEQGNDHPENRDK